MVGSYDPNEGVFGFQEYEGSLREENIDGEPRYFRTFFGPSQYRNQFLKNLFGLQIISWDGNGVPCTNPPCDLMLYYPEVACTCNDTEPPPFVTVLRETVMVPVNYRIEPLDPTYSHTLGTENTVFLGIPPQIDCGVLIEVEYRAGIISWPESVHDPSYESSMDVPNSLFEKDVPYALTNTYFLYEEEHSLEFRTIKGRNFEVCSYTPLTLPANANPNGDNKVTVDELDANLPINVNEFTVTWANTPYVPRDLIRQYTGRVNRDVWFGYPAHAVALAGVQIIPKVHVCGVWMYDVRYRFIARTVPASGELQSTFFTLSDPQGPMVHKSMVGVYNRVWWPYTAPGTEQNWWPICLAGQSTPDEEVDFMAATRPFQEALFHELFTFPDTCGEEEE